MTSPFLDIPSGEWLAANRSAFAIADAYPVSPGHTLVVPRRLIATWWDASAEERIDLWTLVDEVKAILDERHAPDAYNVGFNAGAAAGQTVDHLHVHVIPRYAGDMEDPRGGVRHVIPRLGNYLAAEPLPTELGLLDGISGSLRQPLLEALRSSHFDRIDLVVSFVMKSGINIIKSSIEDALDRGADVRVLTSGYLNITDPDAVQTLLDLAAQRANAELRAFDGGATAFHPKAYLFSSSEGGAALGFVGSSNLSRSGIDGGVEWNLRVDTVAPMRRSFERLWADPRTVTIDDAWLRRYRAQVGTRTFEVPAIGELPEAPQQPVEPRELQKQALAALEQTRVEGHRAGLVVMATGLGKTWVAAFDTARPSFRRVLFVAHREEILRQSLEAFRAVRPDATLGFFTGTEKTADADVVFASVQTLANRLDEFRADEFDYVVVDEFHHAAAPTYRRVIDHFDPDFLLGLTATPERMDGADLFALCGDNLVFECDLVDGIRRGDLVPFEYVGIKDVVDFAPIPWRNGRFDPAALEDAIETQERAQQALDEWRARAGARTLAFCATTAHADFMQSYFEAAGVRCAAVHSNATSAPRRLSVEQLRDGDLDVLFAVDVFNEGFDLPSIDTVLMLRPTDSPVVFLQQLGRGLRLDDGKDSLRVIDFIGNHRSFLMKPRVLLSLGGGAAQLSLRALDTLLETGGDLPPGCSVQWELGVIDLFRELLRQRTTAGDALENFVLEHIEEFGERPSAVKTFRAGYLPSTAKPNWFSWLGAIGVLDAGEAAATTEADELLTELQKTNVTKSYKLVTLRALLHDDVLHTGATVEQIAATSQRLVSADPRLVADTASPSGLPDPAGADAESFERYWRKWPLSALTGDLSGNGDGLFEFVADSFRPRFRIAENHHEAVNDLVAELVDWRLAEYLDRAGDEASSTSAALKVSHSNRNPILRFDRDRHPMIPEGWTEVMADGEPIEINFVKIAANLARRPGEQGNALHSLLRRWFGPDAGVPGTRFEVTLEQVDDRWSLRPRGRRSQDDNVIPLFPNMTVACGAFDLARTGRMDEGWTMTRLRFDDLATPESLFVAVASGDSMSGGADPIEDGQHVLLRWVRDESLRSLIGQRVLVEYRTPDGAGHALKELARTGDGYELRSSNEAAVPIRGERDMTVVATYVRTVTVNDRDEPQLLHGIRLQGDDGEEIDATIGLEVDGESVIVTVESSGGTRGSASARNLDYVAGVDLLLRRAAGAELVLTDAFVDSDRTQHLSIEERRLDAGWPYPVELSAVSDPVEVRRKMLRSMAQVGRPAGSTGSGNSRKRFSLVFSGGDGRTTSRWRRELGG